MKDDGLAPFIRKGEHLVLDIEGAGQPEKRTSLKDGDPVVVWHTPGDDDDIDPEKDHCGFVYFRDHYVEIVKPGTGEKVRLPPEVTTPHRGEFALHRILGSFRLWERFQQDLSARRGDPLRDLGVETGRPCGE